MNRKLAYLLSALVLLALIAVAAVAVAKLLRPQDVTVPPRVPYVDGPVIKADPTVIVRNTGTLIPGTGKPSDDPGSWPWFRGEDRSNVASPKEKISRTWPPDGPQVLWRLPLGEGHAGPAVLKGRVFIVDYDREKQEDAIRCLSLADGAEIWRYTYYEEIPRNHGMSRTVPAVTDEYVVALGPMGKLTCLRMETGELVWKTDLVAQYGSVIPSWYAGQCPLIDGDRLIIATGGVKPAPPKPLPPGGNPLMVAVDIATGKVLWETPNPANWGMTHNSIVTVTVAGRKQYLYATTMGLVSVDAQTGAQLWTLPEWKVKLANIPTPVPVGDDRVLLTGGYGSGAMMIRVLGDPPGVETVFRLPPEAFGSEQHTPILYHGRFYGSVSNNGYLTCIDLDGRVAWTSGSANRFGLGPFFIADGVIFILNDMKCTLHMIEASPTGYRQLASAKVLEGHDAWAPMALVNGKLLVRDMTEMVCLKVGTREP